jgi:hypothetical protein
MTAGGEAAHNRFMAEHLFDAIDLNGPPRSAGATRKWLSPKAGDWRFLRCGLPLLMGSKRARS